MSRARLLLFPLSLSLLAAPAFADDGAGGDDLQKLLNSIPDIQQAPPPAAESPQAAEEDGMELPQYTTLVRKAIYANWKNDPKLAEKHPELATQLLVKIDSEGKVTSVAAVKLSGDKKFDKACVGAALATPTVPAPTAALASAASTGLLINFVAGRGAR